SGPPRSREAHGCGAHTRDTARAPNTWRRWPWLAPLAAASRSSARSATAGRTRRPADRDTRRATANLLQRAVHSQTYPPFLRRTILLPEGARQGAVWGGAPGEAR